MFDSNVSLIYWQQLRELTVYFVTHTGHSGFKSLLSTFRLSDWPLDCQRIKKSICDIKRVNSYVFYSLRLSLSDQSTCHLLFNAHPFVRIRRGLSVVLGLEHPDRFL